MEHVGTYKKRVNFVMKLNMQFFLFNLPFYYLTRFPDQTPQSRHSQMNWYQKKDT
jgi:hypothetical protein